MPTIRQLSQSIINKIAAGEVIERPSSVLKELVENSIDAGSRRIDITVSQGGTELIQIVDNGCGIAPEQLSLALTPHATSKIVESDDLFRVMTFGFRGEALASIAEISQLLVRSRPEGSNEGTELRVDGGEFHEPLPCGMPQGTSIEVRNLFFNTPVRRKYMKTVTTEYGHILEAFIRLAIPQPQIHFTFTHNGKTVHDLPPESNEVDRIAKLFGADLASDLVYLESNRGEIGVRGLVSHPNRSRSNNRMQYFFLNSRHVRDRALQHALGEAYRGLLTVGRYPMAFLHIDMPPDQVDVNVHPSKMEVRFLDSNRIYSHFLGAIRERFLSVDLNGRPDLDVTQKTEPTVSPATSPGGYRNTPGGGTRGGFGGEELNPSFDPNSAMDDSVLENVRKKVVDWAAGNETAKTPETPSVPLNRTTEDINRMFLETPTYTYEQKLSSFQTPKNPEITTPTPLVQGELTETRSGEELALTLRQLATTSSGRGVVQMHNRYLVLETEKGIAIVDQHALHERLLYEQFKERIEEGGVDSQRLLVPLPVDLVPNEAACVRENLDFFTEFGLKLEPFGGDTFLITAYPTLLKRMDPLDIFYSLLEPLLSVGKKPNRSEVLEEILHQTACKAAIKMGDSMQEDSIVRLVELAEQEANAHHCPHGRPSMLVFTCEELDKMFKRV